MTLTARMLIGCTLAVVVPAGLLHASAATGRLDAGLTAAPFGWPRVLVAHLAAAVPLGVIVAGWLRRLELVNEAVRGLWVVVGFAVAGLATVVGPAVGEAVADGGFGAVPLLIVRAAGALVLVLPWCVWATDPPAATVRPGAWFGFGAALAVIPCGLYAEAVVAARTEQANERLQREQLVRAEATLTGLVELGSEQPIGKSPPADVRKGLSATVARLRRDAERPLPANPKPAERVRHAVLMVRLDRLADAAAALEPLAPASDPATLLLAAVYRDQERWAASDDLFAGVLEKLLPRAATDPAARDGCQTAINALAFNARADRRPADAERVLKRGIEELPACAADFHFQLGRHYHDGGRSGLALEHLQTAADRDPAKYNEPAGRMIRSIRTATPVCLVGRSR